MSLSSKFGPYVIASGVALLVIAMSLEAFAQRVPQPAAPANPRQANPNAPANPRQANPNAPANPRQANPNAPANPRGNAATPQNAAPATARGGDKTAANNNPTIVGQVVAYEADKSITVEVKRRGGQSIERQFNIVKDKSTIELLGDTKKIAKGTTVSVWSDKDDTKLAARIKAGTPAAGARGQTNAVNPANPGRTRQANPTNPGNVRTPNANGATPNVRGQANPANPAPNPGRRVPQN